MQGESLKTVTTERELAHTTLRILDSLPQGAATYRELMDVIPSEIQLTDRDYEPSKTRPMELMWEQRVRNINCHRNEPTSLIKKGYLKAIPDGLAITDDGRAHLRTYLL